MYSRCILPLLICYFSIQTKQREINIRNLKCLLVHILIMPMKTGICANKPKYKSQKYEETIENFSLCHEAVLHRFSIAKTKHQTKYLQFHL